MADDNVPFFDSITLKRVTMHTKKITSNITIIINISNRAFLVFYYCYLHWTVRSQYCG
jgi:hypothetical protein